MTQAALWDANCLIGRWPSADLAFHDVPGLIARMDHLGIERAVVGHTHGLHFDPVRGNAALSEALAGCSLAERERLMPCWTLVPLVTGELGSPDELAAEMDRHGVRAARLYPRDHNFSLGGTDATELLALLEKQRTVALIDQEQTSWEEMDRLAAAYPALPIIVCNVGYRTLRRMAGVLARRPNCHVDLAYLGSHQGLEWLVERFGPKQVVFGTGAPVIDGGGAVTRLRLSVLDEAAQAAIGHGNLAGLLAAAGAGQSERLVDAVEAVAELPDDWVRQGKTIQGWDILDAHAHVGPWYNFYTPEPNAESMLRVMDRCGVQQTVVSATLAIGPDAVAGNAEVSALVQRYPERFAGYAVFNPHQPGSAADVEQMLEQPGFVGIKIHPDTHAYAAGGPLYEPAWEIADRRGVPVLTHTFVDHPYCDPLHFAPIAGRWPRVPILLGHSGVTGEGHRRAIAAAREHANLYLELCGSFTTGHWITQMVEAVGPERVIYGSDFPFIEMRYGLGRVVFAGLAADDLRLVLGGNARRLLGLKGTG